MSENKQKYLSDEFIAQLDKFSLRARLIVEGFITGLHKSPYHGFSVEFSDHRQYNPGDAIRNVDWKVYAKTNRYYIKRHEEETNLKCYIIIDHSASMGFSSGKISKLEFAKASRGPSSVNAGEFVWGNTSYQTENYSGLTNAGYESELTASATANVHLAPQGIGGPIRVGSFAESSTSRSQAGAGYYGAMDLAGNLWEIVIPLGNSTGRAYTANHGDGALTSAGNADVSGWPSSTSTAQLGKRGGPFLGSANEGRIANRNYANRSFYTTQRKEFDGCRGARSAPEN